jgi:hypothetical protein
VDPIRCHNYAILDGIAFNHVIAPEIGRLRPLEITLVLKDLTADVISTYGFIAAVENLPIELKWLRYVAARHKKSGVTC